jgi:hypothetical protein
VCVCVCVRVYVHKVSASSACDAQAPALTDSLLYASKSKKPLLLFVLGRLRHIYCVILFVCVCVCALFPQLMMHPRRRGSWVRGLGFIM